MNLNNLEKATKIYEKIKTLDAQIIEIDKLALLITNGEVKCALNLTINDIGKKKEEENKVTIDPDGSLKFGSTPASCGGIGSSPLRFFTLYGCDMNTSEKKDETMHLLRHDLTEKATLHVLGVLLNEKQSERATLINSLKKFGVAV